MGVRALRRQRGDLWRDGKNGGVGRKAGIGGGDSMFSQRWVGERVWWKQNEELKKLELKYCIHIS